MEIITLILIFIFILSIKNSTKEQGKNGNTNNSDYNIGANNFMNNNYESHSQDCECTDFGHDCCSDSGMDSSCDCGCN
ncbi:MAG: hypothetical protein RR942_01515 [Romboutsia sp.]